MKKKINSLINTIFPLITIFFLYLGIKSDGDGSFIMGFSFISGSIAGSLLNNFGNKNEERYF